MDDAVGISFFFLLWGVLMLASFGGLALSIWTLVEVLRYRDDKPPSEADTIDTVRAIWERAN